MIYCERVLSFGEEFWELSRYEVMITVVIPLYNKESSILTTLRSVLFQSFREIEVVIVDDGSTDKSVALVKEIQDRRIRIVSQQNAGPSAARNRGVREAKYEWIIFLDADDIMLPDSLSHFVSLVQAYPDITLFCGNHYTDTGNNEPWLYSYRYKDGVIKNNFRAWAFRRCGVRAGTGMFRKELLLENPFDESLRRYEDSEVLFRIMKVCKIYQTKMPTVLYNCRTLGASVDVSNFSKDFLGHLNLHSKTFYERIVMFQLFNQARRDYPEQSFYVYKNWYLRYDLRIICRIIDFLIHQAEKIAKHKENK